MIMIMTDIKRGENQHQNPNQMSLLLHPEKEGSQRRLVVKTVVKINIDVTIKWLKEIIVLLKGIPKKRENELKPEEGEEKKDKQPEKKRRRK